MRLIKNIECLQIQYIPIHVGASCVSETNTGSKDLGYVKDDTGQNISSKNSEYSELTAVYWAWRNLSAEYVGLVHYRRYFSVSKKGNDPFDSIMTKTEADEILKDHAVIIPKNDIIRVSVQGLCLPEFNSLATIHGNIWDGTMSE